MFKSNDQFKAWNNLQQALDDASEIAPCTNYPDLFFPEVGQNPWQARKLCQGCPVIEQCADYGIRFENDGLWGGMTPRERFIKRRELGYSEPEFFTGETIAKPLDSSVDPLFGTDFAEPS